MAESGRRQANVARRATINYRDIGQYMPDFRVNLSSLFTSFCNATSPRIQLSQRSEYLSDSVVLADFSFARRISSPSDTIPEPMTLSHALSLREAKVKEIIETNPATSTPVTKPANTATPIPSIATLRPSPPVTTISETSSSAPARAKGKGRQSNASSKANGTAATNTGTGGTKRTRERKARQNATQAQTQNNGIVGVDDPQKNDQQSHSSNKASARENTTTTGETTRRRSSRANRDTTGGSGNASTPALTTAPATTHVNGVHRSIGPNGLGLHESPPRNSSHSSSYPHSYSADSWEGHRQDHHPTSPSHPYPYPDDHPSRNQHSHSPPAYHHGRETVLWGPGVQPPSGQAPSQRPHTHFTGPASGYLDDPSHRLLFDGRGGGMTGNPGRTIYSQQRAPNR